MYKQLIDIDDKQVKVTNIIDHTSLFEQNKEEAKYNDGFTAKRTMRKVASIPIDVFISMGEKGVEIYNDTVKLREFIRQHPEYRTSGGKI